ncbi:PglZ domain-containing protein [Clostridium grantii]|uniref:PglZ domain-containing protein n=1 Tax=Clostridium grantii DSM 8605 TaxID=1121316 RepID=A0A1M5XXE0_9CLOT|nr:PglZ domain-containing protein [Clostridium grantii]SHI04406.1 PglZ domain-containing protein [Clostridium grantii DSM 8605]
MVTIVKDYSKEYISNVENIIVKDLTSYLLARKKFFSNRWDDRRLEIVIRKSSIFNFFLDIEENSNVSVIIIKEIKDNTEIILTNYFGSTSNIFEILNISRDINKSQLERMKKEMVDSYFNEFPEVIQEEFLKKDSDNLLENMVYCYVFSKYKEHNYNSLVGNIYDEVYKLFRHDQKLKNYFESYKQDLLTYICKCNEILKENYKKIDTFMEFKSTKFLNEISGELKFESEFFLNKILEKFNYIRNFQEVKLTLQSFKEKFGYKIDDIDLLISDLEKIFAVKLDEFKKLDDWKEFFKNEYLKYNTPFLESNLESKIKIIEKKYKVNLQDLKNSINNIWSNSKNKFEIFYLNNYNNLHSSVSKEGLDYALSENIKYISSGKKTLLLFIDCLRYDIWREIKRELEIRGYVCQKEEVLLSAIPTVTSYCKKILYNGKKYNQIYNGDNLKGIHNLFFERKFKKIDNSGELLEYIEDYDVFLYEILDIDYFFHNIKELDLNYISNSISVKLDKLFSNFKAEDLDLIVMTDHGAIKLYDSGLKSIDFKDYLTENNLQFENHGRYIKIYGNYFNEVAYRNLKEKFYNSTVYHCIDRENMNKYYLPIVELNKENYFYLIYKNNFYPKCTGEYNHGGISLEEVMVPFGVFTTERKEYKEIEIEVKNNIIEADKVSEIILLIKNTNEINKFNAKLINIGAKANIPYFDENKLIQIPIKISYTEEKIMDILEIEFYFLNEKIEIKMSIEIFVKENKVKKFNQKIKNSRSLL